MWKTLRTVALMLLAPPLWLYALAQAGAFPGRSGPLGDAMLAGAWAAGAAGIAFSGWRRDVQLVAALAYTLAAIFFIPWLGLLAACSTGDCL